ncbi:hypothetical protein [Geopseudomonas aromaticivorans]
MKLRTMIAALTVASAVMPAHAAPLLDTASVQAIALPDANRPEFMSPVNALRFERDKIVEAYLLSSSARTGTKVDARSVPGLMGGEIKAGDQMEVDLWFQQRFSHQGLEYHVGFIKLRMIDPFTGKPADSHAATADIAAVTYQVIENKWRVISRQVRPITTAGSWGDAAEPEAVSQMSLGKETALLVPGSFMNMGIIESGEQVLVFNGSSWSTLGFITTGLSDDCTSYEGLIKPIAGGGSHGRPDLLVERTGFVNADYSGCNPRPISNELYRFNGSEYVLVDSE